jgi:hypothetical protein
LRSIGFSGWQAADQDLDGELAVGDDRRGLAEHCSPEFGQFFAGAVGQAAGLLPEKESLMPQGVAG